MAEITVRAFDPTGQREVVTADRSPLVVSLDDGLSDHRMATACAELLGSPVALLCPDPAEVEVLGTALGPGLAWASCSLDVADRSPWTRPGWYGGTLALIDEALALCGVARSGPPVQTKHWSISAILRVPTTQGDAWFKQVPPVFAHEGRIVQVLSSPVVPGVLAVGDGWWLSADLPPEIAAEGYGYLAVLVDLQRTVDPRALVAVGCPDRTLPMLLADLEPLIPSAALSAVEAAAGRLAALGLPDGLVHGDLHEGNVRLTEGGWVIYDWTDGCVGHPLMDLQPGYGRQPDDAARAAFLEAAAAAWEVPMTALLDGVLVAAAHQVVSYQRIVDGLPAGPAAEWTPAREHWEKALFGLVERTTGIEPA